MNRRSFVKTAASAWAAAPFVGRIPRSAAAASKFDPGFATAGQAVRAIRSGVISARELTEHTYRRISQHNPKVNAFITLIEEQAMARAREADDALAAGKVLGPPVGLQIMGPYLEDATPIAIAGHVADVVGGFEAPPGYA